MRRILMLLVVLAVSTPAWAQTVIPIRYRMTLTAPGQATITHVVAKTAMTCNLAIAEPPERGLRITDPERATPPGVRDCQWVDTAGAIFAGMVREIEYTYTIAGQANDLDPYGPESVAVRITLPRIPQIPGAPANPRVRPPGTLTIALEGSVLERGSAFGLDVATTQFDTIPGFPFYFGAATLTAPGVYSVTPGDRFVLQLWRP